MLSARKVTMAVGAALVLTVVSASPVRAAAGTTVSSEVKSGSTGDVVGTASFTRTANNDGTETLSVTASIPHGTAKSHLCLATEPFTDRTPPGDCDYSESGGATTITYTVNLGASYAAKTLYIQFHVDLGGDSAYAGWHEGKPFFGNLSIHPNETHVPVGAVGAVILAGITGLAFIVVQRRSVRRGARPTVVGA